MKSQTETGSASQQKFYLLIAGGAYLLAWVNNIFNLNLFNLPTSIFSYGMIFLASVILWLFVALDWPSLLCILALSFLPEVGFSTVGKMAFGNTTFIFLLFTFIVTYGLHQSSLLQRMTTWAMNGSIAQSNPWRFIVMMLSTFLLLATFLSPTVLFMFALPLYEEVCLQFGFKKGERIPAYLLIGLFTTIAIGTAMTPINHVFAITAISLYETTTSQSIGYSQYILIAMPTGLVIYSVLLATLSFLIKKEMNQLNIKAMPSLEIMPPLQKREKWVIGLFIFMVSLWLLPELMSRLLPSLSLMLKDLGIAFPPLLVTILLAMIKIDQKPLINIQEAIQKGVHWPSLFLVAATMTLGSVMSLPELGLLDLLSSTLGELIVQFTPWFIILFFVMWVGIQTNFSSNLVTVTMVTSLMLSIRPLLLSNAVNLATLVCLIGFMASLAWMTPPAMPYVAISIGTGWTESRQVFIMGLWMLFLSIILVMVIGYPIGTLIF